jgi:hypothetical protein
MDWNSPKDVLGLIPADDIAAMRDATYTWKDYGDRGWSEAYPSVRLMPRQLLDPSVPNGDCRCPFGIVFDRQHFLTAEQEEIVAIHDMSDIYAGEPLQEPELNPGAEEVDEFLFHLAGRTGAPGEGPSLIDVGAWFIDGFDTCYYREQTPRDFIAWAVQQETCCDYVNQGMLDALREG